jgi:hypothetical protein
MLFSADPVIVAVVGGRILLATCFGDLAQAATLALVVANIVSAVEVIAGAMWAVREGWQQGFPKNLQMSWEW